MKLRILLIPALLIAISSAANAGHDSRYRSGDGWAREYADTAIRQVRQNRNQGCGYYGQRWSDSYQAHYQWALSVDWRTGQAEIDQRDADLRACASRNGYAGHRTHGDRGHDRSHQRAYERRQPLARFSRNELARWYADTALAQVGESNRFGCRLSSSSGRWSRSWQAHYRWALGRSRHELLSEVRKRDRTLEDCGSYAYRGY